MQISRTVTEREWSDARKRHQLLDEIKRELRQRGVDPRDTILTVFLNSDRTVRISAARQAGVFPRAAYRAIQRGLV